MGKLIKYEIRKQRASRMVIFVALAAALIMFWGGLLFENDMMMAISIMAMTFGAFLVLFYTGIESILVLNRDLRTKQSYMPWGEIHLGDPSDADRVRRLRSGGGSKHGTGRMENRGI